MTDPESKAETGLTSPPYSIFSQRQKALIVAIVSFASTFSGFASNIYFPSIPTISADLSVSAVLVDLTVTSYMIFQGLSPSFWGAFADVRGRRITYICTFVVFIGACVGLAETRYFYQLIILRCLQSTGSASTIAIGAGVLGDITTREERGGYMGLFQAGTLVPLAVGPVLGGIFAGTLGWRAIFWFLVIYGGAFLIILILFLPETLRSLVGNGSISAKGFARSPLAYLQQKRHSNAEQTLTGISGALPAKKKERVDFLGPLRILLGIEVSFVILFLAIYYTVWQMTIAAMSTLYKATYGLDDIQIGLTFIANGGGCLVGTLFTGKVLDFDYCRILKRYTGTPEHFPLENARLRTVWLWSGIQGAAVVVFGWTLEQRVHISVPIICTFILGWAATSIQSVITTFLVDVFPKKSASATAALNLARCLMGAGGTAAILPLINAINVGWTFTLFTGVMVAALGLIMVQLRCGPEWRCKREEREEEAGGS
ncbi:hypothetical protein BZG36_04354 [Bifiguratus adelaidae]|uniref:Major facilitator superfamily (MFS) profile domain-containing protein n=1 Tax=Bifiguratus adelaidae TaxID=1938954 RepID=A0A261XWV3_9FUNG|nr:hypothetical protein BZG36_04354 [Bifiguratus adelaidae]